VSTSVLSLCDLKFQCLHRLGDTRTLHVHIRTISGNTKHPFAQQSPLPFSVFAKLEHLYGAAPVETATLQIARNTLALFLCSNTEVPILAIWDWTTSELILVSLPDFIPLSVYFINHTG
jgi:hypothetical protein